MPAWEADFKCDVQFKRQVKSVVKKRKTDDGQWTGGIIKFMVMVDETMEK